MAILELELDLFYMHTLTVMELRPPLMTVVVVPIILVLVIQMMLV